MRFTLNSLLQDYAGLLDGGTSSSVDLTGKLTSAHEALILLRGRSNRRISPPPRLRRARLRGRRTPTSSASLSSLAVIEGMVELTR